MDRLIARLRPARAVRLLLATLLLAGSVTFIAIRPAHAATSHHVAMSGYAFSPRALTITAGDTVTWVNQDQAPHNVKTTSGPESIQSPMLNKGGTWSHTFTTPGTYGYVCTVHPGMTAQLVVEPAAASTPATHATTHHHTASAPAAVQPARSSAAPTGHAGHSGTAAAPASGSPSASPIASAAPTGPTQQTAVSAESTASAARPLDPLLLLAAVVAGVAVLCLLLVGSRSAPAGARDSGASSS